MKQIVLIALAFYGLVQLLLLANSFFSFVVNV